MANTSELAGQVCVVTGGGRGIGHAICCSLLTRGAEVHALDLVFADDSGGVTCHSCDISDRAQVDAAIGPRVDVLVNNAAAVTRAAPLGDLTAAEWNQALSVNLTGMFNVTQAVLLSMGQGGRIINLASSFAHVGARGRVAYSTTKAGILGFTRSLALDVAERGIRVNSVSPGAVATDRLVDLFGSQEAAHDALAGLHPVGRAAIPEEIADGVCFLASDASRFMTGADLRVDGGYTAQ